MRLFILIVDDEESNRRYIKRILQGNVVNCEMEFAANGREAIEMVDLFHPDCIIMDVRMPTMDGFQVLEYLSKTPKYNSIKILLMSGEMTEAMREKALRLGAADTFAKPFTPTELLEKLKQVLYL